MKGIRFGFWISLAVLFAASSAIVLFTHPRIARAQVGTPPSSTISSTSDPLAWDFGPVRACTAVNVWIQDICRPGLCDVHDMTGVLPAPAVTFYQTRSARLT